MVYRKLFTPKEIRGVQKKVFMNNLEAGTIKKLSKLASQHSKKFYQTKKIRYFLLP